MKQLILLVLLLLSFNATMVAQTKPEAAKFKCTLGVNESPELRGFRLGTPQASVLARFPGTSVEPADKFGLSRLYLSVIDTSLLPKTMSVREKGVQPQMAGFSGTPGAEAGFIIDGNKFPTLKGVRQVRLQFTDGRLSYLQLAYDDSVKWNDIDEFVENVALKLSLPGEWKAPANDAGTNQKEMRCEGFVITGDVSSDATDTRTAARLSLEDLVAAKLIEKRQIQLKEKVESVEETKRKNFKP